LLFGAKIFDNMNSYSDEIRLRRFNNLSAVKATGDNRREGGIISESQKTLLKKILCPANRQTFVDYVSCRLKQGKPAIDFNIDCGLFFYPDTVSNVM